jgi:hypothetical protein
MILCPEEMARLRQLDEGLRDEADRLLSVSGLGSLLQQHGFAPVGSYVMRTMTWRDLDFERIDEAPDWDRHWELGAALAQIAWVWRLHCHDAYRKPDTTDRGLYWGMGLSDPTGGPAWKVDIWTARAEEFAEDDRVRWTKLLTEEARCHILAIKESVCDLPEYRRQMLSVHIYEAVLDCGVREKDEFMQWWKARQ